MEVKKAGGSLAYSAQSPWLESMSIRDNILFETAYDPSRYGTSSTLLSFSWLELRSWTSVTC